MKGDAGAPMVDEIGLKWKPDTYFDAHGRKLLPGTTLGSHYASDLFNLALAQLCAAAVTLANTPNVRAHAWKVSNAIDKAMEGLPDYPTLKYGFGQILTITT